jgi:MtrB/PioB family decaheme-associated outer membrane protein
MNHIAKTHRVRALVLAVRAALLSLTALAVSGPALAADPAMLELTAPVNTVEIGAATVSQASAKAQEYNGVSRKGLYGIANVELRGGGAYDSADALRWRFGISDLGLDNRETDFSISNQGQFKLDLHYGEFQRQRSDSYQTPYLGVGTNVLTLPSNWMVPLVPRVSGTAANARGLSPDVTASPALVAGVPTAPTAAQLATSAAIQAADLPAFHQVHLSTKRTQYGAGLAYEFNRHWQVTASYASEAKQGLKPMGSITRFTGGDISAVIPDLIDQNHEQINLGLNYHGEQLTLGAAYYGSLFVNNVTGMSWASWAAPGNTQTLGRAPSNQFHQLSLNGSYALSSSTRLSGNLSYGRSTQNETFLTDISTPFVPVTSLNGLLVSKGLNLKLQSRPLADLVVSASYKLDDRDNRTPVNTYAFYDAGEPKAGTSVFSAYFPGLGADTSNINANLPYSKKLSQYTLEGDYAFMRGQALKAGLDYQTIDRHCAGTWITCTEASTMDETTARAEWRFNAVENLQARLGLSSARRTVNNYNENAFLSLVPAANLTPSTAPAGVTSAYAALTALGVNGWGVNAGLPTNPLTGSQAFYFANNNPLANALYGNHNRISELPGMRLYNLADRKRDKLRAAANWQASDALSLQAGVDINNDRYGQSRYGLQSAKGWALNVEGNYEPNDKTSITLFYSHENQKTLSAGNTYTANSTATAVAGFTAISGGCFATIALRNASNKIDPCLDWQTDMHDQVGTLGLAYTQRGLAGGKLEFSAGLTYSAADTDINTIGGNYANNPLAVAGAPAGTVAAYYIAATPLPTVKTDTTELKLAARYALSKQRTVRLAYSWQHMKAVDWAYEGFQPGGLALVLPTYEQAPNYNVHTIAVSYIYSFR